MTPRRILFYALLHLPLFALAAPLSEKVIERYKQMLAASPAEGTALERLWQAYSEQGRSGALIAEFEQQPGFSAQMVLGHLLKRAGRQKDAAQAFQRALTIELRNPAPALALGRLEMAMGNPQQAAIWLGKAAELIADGDAQKAEALMELGTAHLAAGSLTQAAAAWERMVTLAPSDMGLRRQLADTYTRNGLGSRAIPHLLFIEQRGQPQDRAQALQQMAAIHQAQGEQDAAISAIERGLTYAAPGNWLRGELQAHLIRLHQRYHRTAELESKWKKYAQENARDRGAYLQLIDFYHRVGDRTQELAWLEKLVQLAPKENEYRLRLARLLAELDQLDRAAKVYDELLGSQPRNVELVFERSRIDMQRDEAKVAGERIESLLQRTGNDEGVRAKALEFYQTNRLPELTEKHLRQEAKGGSEEGILALASFLFSNHRDAEARDALKLMVRPSDPPAAQAAAHFRIAEQLKGQNDLAGAITAVRKAINLQHEVRDYHFVLGELEAASGHYAAAEVAFEAAFVVSKTAIEALEADQRLYDSLRSQKQPGEDEPRSALPRPDAAAAVTSAVAQGYLLKIQRDVVDNPTEEGWLRVARWQQWSRNGRMAVDAAERALAINPKSLPAHDFLARHFAADPQAPGAQQHLRELVRLDPANRTTYLRRLGQVLIQTGQVDEALKTFKQLVDDAPGDIDSLNDLALAQQRAEQWKEALVTLEQIFQLTPDSRKRDAAGALLRVYERLAMRERAASLLLQRIDAESDNKDRFALLQELLGLCTRHGLLEWLRVQFQERRKLRVDDYFTEVALGRVLKAQGNKAAAFEVLSDAAFAAPNPAEALPELVREAEELRRLDAAVQLQMQLVRTVPQTGTEGLERLAQLQEKNLQPDEAAKTWTRITAKFPREVPALEKAAEFERTWGTVERSIELLRRIRMIEPANLRALARLAEFDMAEGHTGEAIQCLEGVLSLTTPEKADDPIRYPALKPEDPSRLEVAYHSTVQRRRGQPSADALRSLREFWYEKAREPKGKDDLTARLETIRNLAELIASSGDADAVAAWIRRWQAPGNGLSERLWALHFVGASSALLDEVETLMVDKGRDAAVNAFIWLALETGEFERLARWTQESQRTPADRDFLVVALEHYLREADHPVSPDMVERLFPQGYSGRLWQAATAFAQRGLFREAIKLGDRVIQQVGGSRAAYALELARWQVQIGDITAACSTLRESLQGAGEGYSAPEYAIIRTAFLLFPPEERSSFVAEIQSGTDELTQPVHTALVRTLLAGLAGQEKKARAHLDALLQLRPIASAFTDERATAATRRWDFLLITGAQLVAWQLDELASYLWEKALADEATIALQTQLPAPEGELIRLRVHELRTRLAAIRLTRSPIGDRETILSEYGRHAPAEGLLPLAETLEAMGGNPVAVMIYRRLWEQEPANPHALRNVLSACRGVGDWNTLEEILSRVVSEGHFRPNVTAHRDLVQQLAEVLEKRQDYEHARAALAEVAESGPHDARLLLKLGNLQERCGNTVAAEGTYRRLLSREPTNIAARLSLAALLDANGKTTVAIDLLERASGTEIDSRLAVLNLKAGRLEEALGALERVPSAEHARTAQALADQLEAKGDAERARYLIRSALARSSGERSSFELQARLIRMLPAQAEAAVVDREVRRLRQFSEAYPEGKAEYFDLMSGEAERLGIAARFRKELRSAWSDGTGELEAGIAMLGDVGANEIEPIWVRVMEHPSLDKRTLGGAINALEKLGDEARRVQAIARMARLNAEDPKRLTEWARVLHANQHQEEALQVAEELAARAVFSPELTPLAAGLFAEIDEVKKARDFYAKATASDPAVRAPEVYIAYARLLIGLKEFGAAKATLRSCNRHPSAMIVPVVLEYLKASGQLEDGGPALADLNLSKQQWLELQRGIFSELLSTGNPGAALGIAKEHPQIMGVDQSRILIQSIKDPADFEAAATLLEQLRTQGAEDDMASQLADLLAAWADAELASLQVDSALAHLARAHELSAAKWPITERLAGLYLDRGQPAKAAQVVQLFLAASKDAAERDKANQLLSRIPAS